MAAIAQAKDNIMIAYESNQNQNLDDAGGKPNGVFGDPIGAVKGMIEKGPAEYLKAQMEEALDKNVEIAKADLKAILRESRQQLDEKLAETQLTMDQELSEVKKDLESAIEVARKQATEADEEARVHMKSTAGNSKAAIKRYQDGHSEKAAGDLDKALAAAKAQLGNAAEDDAEGDDG